MCRALPLRCPAPLRAQWAPQLPSYASRVAGQSGKAIGSPSSPPSQLAQPSDWAKVLPIGFSRWRWGETAFDTYRDLW